MSLMCIKQHEGETPLRLSLDIYPVPECIDLILAKTSPKRRSFSMTENERFGLVFAKTRSINSATEVCCRKGWGRAE
jgi:hypothetical protein